MPARTHGMSATKIYKAWQTMLERCRSPNNWKYKDYGGRGITVCEQWYSFVNFYNDMGDRPEGTTIDRIDNDLGYYKENCKWSTPTEQALNRRKRNGYMRNENGTFMRVP